MTYADIKRNTFFVVETEISRAQLSAHNAPHSPSYVLQTKLVLSSLSCASRSSSQSGGNGVVSGKPQAVIPGGDSGLVTVFFCTLESFASSAAWGQYCREHLLSLSSTRDLWFFWVRVRLSLQTATDSRGIILLSRTKSLWLAKGRILSLSLHLSKISRVISKAWRRDSR